MKASDFANIGTLADRPAASARKWCFYSQTDSTPGLYFSDGSAWALVASDGTPGADGADGATWYSGSGAPSGGTGVNGDFYLRTSNGDVYLKSGGSWSVITNLTGPTGATGSTGATGATGSAGTNGSTWYSGSGAPGGGTGVNGDYYFRTDTGQVYAKSGGSWSAIANLTGPTGPGSGDVVGPSSSVDSELAIFDSTTGKLLKRASGSGFVKVTSGVFGVRSAAQATSDLDAMVGDSGSGGTKGLAPAPASGDAAAGKFLKADGTWAVPSGAGGTTLGLTAWVMDSLSWLTQQSATLTSVGDGELVLLPAASAGGMMTRGRSIPASNFVATMHVQAFLTGRRYNSYGMYVRASGGGLIEFNCISTQAGGKNPYIEINSWTWGGSSFSFGSNIASMELGQVVHWFRILEDSTTRYFQVSPVGIDGSWVTVLSHGKTTTITTAEVGYCAKANATDTPTLDQAMLVDYFHAVSGASGGISYPIAPWSGSVTV